MFCVLAMYTSTMPIDGMCTLHTRKHQVFKTFNDTKGVFLDMAVLGCPSSTYLHPLPGHFWFCFFSIHPLPLIAYSFLTFSLHPLSHSLQPPPYHPHSLLTFPYPPFPPHLSTFLLPHSSSLPLSLFPPSSHL